MERNTRQREIIKEVFRSEGRPLSPPEILSLAKASLPGLSLATVYRAIKGLTEEGWLSTVEVPGLPSYYEIDRHSHHHHFFCQACGRVYEAEGCVPVESLTPEGFSLESHEILLRGRCGGCGRR